MSKFNENKKPKLVLNLANDKAYGLSIKEKLMSMVATSFINESKFYGDNTEELIELAKAVDGEFLTKLAIYARTELNLRSVSHVLAVIIANYHKDYTKYVIPNVVIRVDDMTEILAFQLSQFGRTIPNQLKKQLAKVLGKFNEYSLSKYKGNKKTVSLRDLVRLTHPTPCNQAQADLYGRIVSDTLETPYTWEVEVSARGNTKEVWEELIDSNALGYMAMLRNLRNMEDKVSMQHLAKVAERLENPEEVKKSKQLPFRFYSAYEQVITPALRNSLAKALETSLSNIERLEGRTLIAVDVSASMRSRISSKSDVTCAEIARILGAMTSTLCEEYDLITFDEKYREIRFNPKHNLLDRINSMEFNGGGTNIGLAFDFANKQPFNYDRIIILSDNMCNYGNNNAKFVKYKETKNKNCWLHEIDLQGYGTCQFKGKNRNLITGWNEKVLSYITLAEQGLGSMVKYIESIKIK